MSIHITLSPKTAQLEISSRHPKRDHTDWERAAEMNQARVTEHRERVENNQGQCKIVYGGDATSGLVALKYILDSETDDARVVGEAFSRFIAVELTPEKVAAALREQEERDRRAQAWGNGKNN